MSDDIKARLDKVEASLNAVLTLQRMPLIGGEELRADAGCSAQSNNCSNYHSHASLICKAQ